MSELKRKTPLRKKAFAEREIKPETKQPRKKTCAICKEKFPPMNSMAKVCSPACATEYAKQIRLKKERKEDRERKQKLKTKRDYLEEAQKAWNSYVRARDYGLPCCSCGATPEQAFGGTMDCSHYRSRGAAPHLSFHLHNAAAACVKCNRYLGGNIAALRVGLVEKFGEEKIVALESNNNIVKFSIEYLKRIKKIFTKKARRQNERNRNRY